MRRHKARSEATCHANASRGICSHGGSVRYQSEELARGGEGIGVRASGAGNVGERAADNWRGLQIESGVGPAQH